jgi:nucleoside-diphosphate-sugar epimerase
MPNSAAKSDAAMIATESELDNRLSEPTPGVIETVGRTPGDFILLGIAGKMGPTLGRMLRRACDAVGDKRRVIGVARFSSGGREQLEQHGIETIPCDLMNDDEVAKLPDAPNVVFMAGRKFGSTGDASLTWAMNCYSPAVVCRRYRTSRIVAFSTGNVYGLSGVERGGSRETDVPQPVGEYAMTALGRERMFEFFSRSLGIATALVRLNYACELRYGVAVDLAQKIAAGEPIDLAMSWCNIIWQRDANAMAIRAFDHVASPPWVLNVAGPELLRVRDVCERLGELIGKPANFTGEETRTALLSDASLAFERFGRPTVSADELLTMIADWVGRGGRSLGKPTHFESRDGKF